MIIDQLEIKEVNAFAALGTLALIWSCFENAAEKECLHLVNFSTAVPLTQGSCSTAFDLF